MNVKLQLIDDAFHLEGLNDTENKVYMDANPKAGGGNKGARPMQLMLMSVAGCSSIDVLSILRKQKQPIMRFGVIAQGVRDSTQVPSPFKSIHLIFQLWGDIDKSKAERAAELSITKYCSASASLHPDIVLSWEIQVSA